MENERPSSERPNRSETWSPQNHILKDLTDDFGATTDDFGATTDDFGATRCRRQRGNELDSGVVQDGSATGLSECSLPQRHGQFCIQMKFLVTENEDSSLENVMLLGRPALKT